MGKLREIVEVAKGPDGWFLVYKIDIKGNRAGEPVGYPFDHYDLESMALGQALLLNMRVESWAAPSGPLGIELTEVEAHALLCGLIGMVDDHNACGEDIQDSFPGLDVDTLLARLREASGDLAKLR